MKYFFCLLCVSMLAHVNAQNNPPPPPPPAIGNPYPSNAVMVQAKFPGGPDAWVKYLQRNLRMEVAYDNIVLRKHQKDSVQRVLISFLVDTTGNITEVNIENPEAVNPAVGAEAKRVIERGPKWEPATIDGKPVIYRQRQSISFMVSKDN